VSEPPANPRAERAIAALQNFYRTELEHAFVPARQPGASEQALALFRDVAARVPAYRAFLQERALVAEAVTTVEAFARLPWTSKENYHRRHSLAELCREGVLTHNDMLAVSSGSTGEPAVWPRFVSDEIGTAYRFEQILADAFAGKTTDTLAVVCFALGSWVGGMYTTACLRHVAAKGYPLTVVTPGNNKAEILRVVRALAPSFSQLVLCGYPPFLKDVIDAGRADGFDWTKKPVRLVLAGEVFSEEWRDIVCERLGQREPELASASLYGTADGGVLACETPFSIRLRRAIANDPALTRDVFGEARLPTLCQYDPFHRYFELDGTELLFTGDGGAPLIRYKILDRGGLIPFETANHRVRGALGKDVSSELANRGIRVREQPLVYVFGRTNFALSFYGANVYPENVAAGIEQPELMTKLSGKFVLQVAADRDENPMLELAVELLPKVEPSSELERDIARSVQAALERVNSEFLAYAPAERRTPRVRLYPNADATYFPLGVKHRYTRH